jgi:3-dehydroquinate dehydratase II
MNAKKKRCLLVLHGPNFDMLGRREPALYGKSTLKDVEALCRKTADKHGFNVDCRQSNNEGDLIAWIHESASAHQGIVINAGAWTHTSIAILDALRLAGLPVVEVHISNIYAREPFRHHSFVSHAAVGVISGLGISGYAYAVAYLAEHLGARLPPDQVRGSARQASQRKKK